MASIRLRNWTWLLLVAFTQLSFLSVDCLAEAEGIDITNLVRSGEPIVIGTLTGVREYSTNGVDCGSGTITVHETLNSRKSVATNIVLKWRNMTTGPICPRYEYGGAKDVKFIWALSLDKDGQARGGMSTRVFSLQQKAQILDLIKNVK